MSDEITPPEEFPAYSCSIGTVLRHEGPFYIIATFDGSTIGIRSNTTPSEANVEADIASPAPQTLTPAEAEALLDTILDGWAIAWGYSSAARCITYVGDPDPTFNAEAVAMRSARSGLWVAVRAAAATPEAPATYTEATVRAFAAQFEPARPTP